MGFCHFLKIQRSGNLQSHIAVITWGEQWLTLLDRVCELHSPPLPIATPLGFIHVNDQPLPYRCLSLPWSQATGYTWVSALLILGAGKGPSISK